MYVLASYFDPAAYHQSICHVKINDNSPVSTSSCELSLFSLADRKQPVPQEENKLTMAAYSQLNHERQSEPKKIWGKQASLHPQALLSTQKSKTEDPHI